jgi:hypothetical protein
MNRVVKRYEGQEIHVILESSGTVIKKYPQSHQKPCSASARDLTRRDFAVNQRLPPTKFASCRFRGWASGFARSAFVAENLGLGQATPAASISANVRSA